MCLNHVIHHSAKEPEAPSDLRSTNSGSTEVTLKWTRPEVSTKGGLSYTVSPFRLFCIYFYENTERIFGTLGRWSCMKAELITVAKSPHRKQEQIIWKLINDIRWWLTVTCIAVALVVQRIDIAIHWIEWFVLLTLIHRIVIYSASGYHYPAFEQPGRAF